MAQADTADVFQIGGISRLHLPEASLPREIMQLLPSDHMSQLELAHHISCYAYSSKASQAEAEAQQLKQTVAQKTSQVKTLESRVTSCQLELQEVHDKLRLAEEAQHRLGAEKQALIGAVRKLNHNVAQLASFKRNLLNSLQADEEVRIMDEAETSLATIDQASERLVANVLRQAQPQGPYGTATSGSFAAAQSPTRSTAAYSAANAPPTSAPASPKRELDGKGFFKEARQRLSNDAFDGFLKAIKDLNTGKQTREQTLQTAHGIFGPAQEELYSNFEALLSRHLPA